MKTVTAELKVVAIARHSLMRLFQVTAWEPPLFVRCIRCERRQLIAGGHMAWLRSNWRWTTLNGCGVLILLVVMSRGSLDWRASNTFDPSLESGKWAIRCLLFCLAMSPLNTAFRWRQALKLRKPAGLWSFAFGVVHVLLL